MADWFGSRRKVRWRYMRVSWETKQELEEYAGITGGDSEESYFTSIKEGGSLTFVGVPLSTIDLVRTYYEFVDDSGEQVSVPVCTQIVDEVTTKVSTGGMVTGSARTYSVLKVADDRLCGLPYTVKAGTKAVEHAAGILEGFGLSVSATSSTYTLANDHTFKPDESYLTVVNWLLAAAGYGSASTDAYGTVIMAPYVDASQRTPVFTFVDDSGSIMYPEADNESNFSETPNVVRMYSEDEYGGYWAVVSNVDADSPASLQNRGGRERTLYDEETQLEPAYDSADSASVADTKSKQRVAALVAMAKQKLLDNSAEIEYVTIRHGFYPISQGDSVEIQYEGFTWRGVATNIRRTHGSESQCELKVRRYVQREIETTVQSGVIR